MLRRTRVWLIATVVVLAIGGVVAFQIHKKRNAGTEVRLERVSRRDLVASVTASGKIEAKTSVEISADITGRIIDIAVREGDLVKRGQFLLQIDPAQYQGVVSSTEATLLQTRATRDQAQRAWNRARQLKELGDNLIAPETSEQAQTALDVAEANYQATKAQLDQARASLQ